MLTWVKSTDYLTKGERARQVMEDVSAYDKVVKVGAWDGFPLTRTNGMLTVFGLCLLGGREQGDGAGWPKAEDQALTYVKPTPEDSANDSAHDVFLLITLSISTCLIKNLYLIASLIYIYIFKPIVNASRGESSYFQIFIFCKSRSVLSSSEA